MAKNNNDLFDMETGKYMANLALKVNLLEKKIKKNASTSELLSFYNKMHQLCDDFKNEIIILENEVGDNR